ncbi:UDP-glucose 4-epimerase GalE [Aestuariibius insulae]|uniref:UDP-glucose 4-epimerase GalE n=1 Tax=Aestuariibius insulae TaxID=2058287 RepID=UPI00345EB0F3
MILITGGAGYIGRHLVQACIDTGQSCAVVDDLSNGSHDSLPQDIPFFRACISDGTALRGILRSLQVKTVVHLAARTSVSESIEMPMKYYDTNVNGTRVVATACLVEGVSRLIYASTAAVYGVPATREVTEDSPTTPVSPYGRSKLAAEWILSGIAQAEQLRTISLRFFNVAGGQVLNETRTGHRAAPHLLAAVSRVAFGDQPYLEIFGDDYDTHDGTCIRDFIHVRDLCSAILLASKGGADNESRLNIGAGHGISVREIVSAAENQIGARLPCLIRPRRPGDVASIVANAQRLRTLGWRPQHSSLPDLIGLVRDLVGERDDNYSGQKFVQTNIRRPRVPFPWHNTPDSAASDP